MWNKIIESEVLKQDIDDRIHDIFNILSHQQNRHPINNLMSGEAGIILFFLSYYQLTEKEEHLELAIELIEEVLYADNANNFPTFSGGLAGLAWAIMETHNRDFLEIDTDELFQDLDAPLHQYMMNEITKGNYDYLHGAIGVGLYFLNRNTPTCLNYVSDLITVLNEKAIHGENGSIKWDSYKQGELIKDDYNLGLSHGIPSIIAFLAKAYQQNISPQITLELLQGSVQFVLQSKFTTPNNGYFPYVAGNEEAGRLAWCYGDLGVCCALWHAVDILPNTAEIKTVIHEVMLFNAQRRELGPNLVQDPMFCHGAVGIAHIFNRMYQRFGTEAFKETAQYWYQQTLTMGDFEDGLAGFKYYGGAHGSSSYVNNSGLLEGIAGIGLALIATISDHDPIWDRAFLIS